MMAKDIPRGCEKKDFSIGDRSSDALSDSIFPKPRFFVVSFQPITSTTSRTANRPDDFGLVD